MKAERESLEPAKWSTLARTSEDSVMEVFSFILLIYYYFSVSDEDNLAFYIFPAGFRPSPRANPEFMAQ